MIVIEMIKCYTDPKFKWWKDRINEVQWARGNDSMNSERV